MITDSLSVEINSAGIFGSPVSALTPIGNHVSENDVAADATEKFRLTLQNGDTWAVLVSSTQGSDLVARAVANQRIARSLLSESAQHPIELPLATGSVDGRTFAVWPWRQALSRHRFIAGVQRRLMSPRVFRWLRELTRHSLLSPLTSEQISTNYVAPLEAAIENPERPEVFRQACRAALGRLQSGNLEPAHILQHSDLWVGNVLHHRRSQFGIVVIDWAGSRAQGYPFLDLTRFAKSSGAGKQRILSEIRHHSTTIGCEPHDARHFAVAGLAMMGLELEYFPVDHYHTLCVGTVAFIDWVIGTE